MTLPLLFLNWISRCLKCSTLLWALQNTLCNRLAPFSCLSFWINMQYLDSLPSQCHNHCHLIFCKRDNAEFTSLTFMFLLTFNILSFSVSVACVKWFVCIIRFYLSNIKLLRMDTNNWTRTPRVGRVALWYHTSYLTYLLWDEKFIGNVTSNFYLFQSWKLFPKCLLKKKIKLISSYAPDKN